MSTIPRPTFLHLLKLICRVLLFLAAAVSLALRKRFPTLSPVPVFAVIWLFFAVEMLIRFTPVSYESIGCQKQYAHTYQPAQPQSAPVLPSARRILAVAAVWLAFNAVIGAAYLNGHLGKGALILFALAFAVCDMLCVLVFCPFQKWIMKNRCCISCRIYDWDYAMMFTPLLFIRSFYTWSLLLLGIALLVKWEITVRRHPERFSVTTNAALSCAACTEKLCRHKKL